MAKSYDKIVKGMTKMTTELETYAAEKGAEAVRLEEKMNVALFEEGRACKTLDKLTGIFG